MQNMRDCEKTLIVVYFNVYDMNRHDAHTCLEEVSNSLRANFDDTVQILVIPSYNKSGESSVNVLNPRYVPEDEYKQIVNDINEKYNEVMKKIGKNGSNS